MVVCIRAAANGNYLVLKFLIDNNYHISNHNLWEELVVVGDICLAAVKGGNYRCLTYAHHHGCMLTDKCASSAAQQSNHTMLDYLAANQCPMDNSTMKYMLEL